MATLDATMSFGQRHRRDGELDRGMFHELLGQPATPASLGAYCQMNVGPAKPAMRNSSTEPSICWAFARKKAHADHLLRAARRQLELGNGAVTIAMSLKFLGVEFSPDELDIDALHLSFWIARPGRSSDWYRLRNLL